MRARTPSLLMLLLGVALAAPVHAQWKWRDDDGRIHYSNQPPPMSVPVSRILSDGGLLRKKTADPNAAAAGEQAAAEDGGAQPAAAARIAAAEPADAPPKTPADRLNEMRRKMAEKEDAERMARDQQQAQAKVAQWCQDARGSIKLLESDARVASVNADGERLALDDDQRAARLSELRRDLQTHCGKG